MKIPLPLLLLVTLNITASSQNISATDTAKVKFDLSHLRSFDATDNKNLLLGVFVITDGHGGYYYSFDSSGIFRRTDFDCMIKSVTNSGDYYFINRNQIQLVSKYETVVFTILRFDKFLFLVQPYKTKKFKEDFLTTCKLYNKLPELKSKYSHHTTQFFITHSLAEKYLVNFKD